MHSCFHLSSRFGEWHDIFYHPSFTFSVIFSHCACPVHHLDLTKTLWSILIILYSIMFMRTVRSSCLQNCVLFWVVRLLLPSSAMQRFGVSFVCWMNEKWRSLNFMRKSGHLWSPQCCCSMVSSVIEWVESWFVVVTLWFVVCAYFSLVWTGLEWNWVCNSLISLV